MTGTIRAWMSTMTYRRGDIVLVYFPYADLRKVKKRPALVVQADHLETQFTHIILAMITSQTTRAGIACRVLVTSQDANFAQTGLQSDSVIVADHLTTLEPTLIDKKLGVMPDMPAVESALRATLAL